MSYSEFLRRTRKAANLTQDDLAKAISARGHNVTISAISNIERAYYKKQDGRETQPHRRFVILAAEVCGADVNEALREADYASNDVGAEIQIAEGVRVAMLGADKFTTEDRQRFAIAFRAAYETALKMIEEDKQQ